MFRCKCVCGKYETMFDMTEGVAVNAAVMHSMLGDEHIVMVQIKDGGEIVTKHTVTKESHERHNL